MTSTRCGMVALQEGEQFVVQPQAMPIRGGGVGTPVVENTKRSVKIPESEADAFGAQHAEQVVKPGEEDPVRGAVVGAHFAAVHG